MDMKEGKEIDADTATHMTRNYFEKGGDIEGKSPAMPLSDWMCLTIASVEKHSKHFEVKCELYEDPSSDTKSKYKLKISKRGEIEEVSRETKKGSTSPPKFSYRKPRDKVKH
jgi:hypothetical protein